MAKDRSKAGSRTSTSRRSNGPSITEPSGRTPSAILPDAAQAAYRPASGKALSGTPHPKYNAKVLGEDPTSLDLVTSYNNFYEFASICIN